MPGTSAAKPTQKTIPYPSVITLAKDNNTLVYRFTSSKKAKQFLSALKQAMVDDDGFKSLAVRKVKSYTINSEQVSRYVVKLNREHMNAWLGDSAHVLFSAKALLTLADRDKALAYKLCENVPSPVRNHLALIVGASRRSLTQFFADHPNDQAYRTWLQSIDKATLSQAASVYSQDGKNLVRAAFHNVRSFQTLLETLDTRTLDSLVTRRCSDSDYVYTRIGTHKDPHLLEILLINAVSISVLREMLQGWPISRYTIVKNILGTDFTPIANEIVTAACSRLVGLLPTEECNQLAVERINNGRNGLWAINDRCSAEAAAAFKAKLDEPVYQTAITMTGDDGKCLLLHSAYRKRRSFRRTIAAMDNDALHALCFKKGCGNHNGFMLIIKFCSSALVHRAFSLLSVNDLARIFVVKNTRGKSAYDLLEKRKELFHTLKSSTNMQRLEAFDKLKAKHGITDIDNFNAMTDAAFVKIINDCDASLIMILAHMPDSKQHHLLYILYKKNNFSKFDSLFAKLDEAALAKLLIIQPDTKQKSLLELLAGDPARLTRSLSILANHPEAIEQIRGKFNFLRSISIQDGGWSNAAWDEIARHTIVHSNNGKGHRKRDFLPETVTASDHKEKPVGDFLNRLAQRGWKLEKILGRTLIFMRDGEEERLALKIQKTNKNEAAEELHKERNATNALRDRAKKLGLKSDLPEPVEVFSATGEQIYNAINNQTYSNFNEYVHFHRLVSLEDDSIVYAYKASPNYFRYLHDPTLSDDEFKAGMDKTVHDLFLLLKNGMLFPQLADLFHNQEDDVERRGDKGRYFVLVDLLRLNVTGSGRLNRWRESVAYPNVRPTGIADLGDYISLAECIPDYGTFINDKFKTAIARHGAHAGNYLIANLMAEYQYVLFLITGRRAADLVTAASKDGKASKADIFAIWQRAADQLLVNCAQAVAILTGQAFDEMHRFLGAMVDTHRLARQMSYWMTGEYIEDIKANKIPKDVYGDGCKVKVNYGNIRNNTFNSEIGCSIDGEHQDLGTVNGQEPIKEENALLYWMVTATFNHFNQFNAVLADLRKVTANKDVVKSEALRKSAFKSLPKKQFHRLQHMLCEERLKQKSLPDDFDRDALKAESNKHARTHAALTLQGLWRKRRSKAKPTDLSTEDRNGNSLQ